MIITTSSKRNSNNNNKNINFISTRPQQQNDHLNNNKWLFQLILGLIILCQVLQYTEATLDLGKFL